jgi:hypothetical protein
MQNYDNNLDLTQNSDPPEIFKINDSLESDKESKYITIGKGWP